MAAKTARRKMMLPRDQGGDPFQGALFPQETIIIAYTDVAAKNVDGDPITAQVVRLISTTDCHVKFQDKADALAAATDMLIRQFVPEYFYLHGKNYISAIRDASNGSLYVTIMI